MKKLYTVLTFCISSIVLGQAPSGYYSSATGTGYTLKTQLHNIIKGHTDNGYGGLYTTYSTSDRDNYYENNGTVLDMYSERVDNNGNNLADAYEFTYEVENPDDRDQGFGGGSEGEFYNREHIIPQSVFDSDSPMRSDAHFVVPSDKYVNSQRGSFPFGVVPSLTSGDPNLYSNGSKRGNNINSGYSAGYSGMVFEPIDEFKGDIARMIFYFATRYENVITTFNTYDMFDGSNSRVLNQTFLNILYQWHTDDPVSAREIDRNNAIFARQNNRNPYIDHPEYVQSAWSATLSLPQNSPLSSIKMYPNPVMNNVLYISTHLDLEVVVYNVLGKLVLTDRVNTTKDFINISNLSNGIYLIKLESNQGTITKKLIKQ